MSYIPDGRTDEFYNQKFLNNEGKAELKGYDWCAEEVVDCFFDNIDNAGEYLEAILNTEIPEETHETYEWVPTFGDEAETRTIKTWGDLLRARLLDWIESNRNELIVSLIENMDDEELEAIREKINGQIEGENR